MNNPNSIRRSAQTWVFEITKFNRYLIRSQLRFMINYWERCCYLQALCKWKASRSDSWNHRRWIIIGLWSAARAMCLSNKINRSQNFINLRSVTFDLHESRSKLKVFSDSDCYHESPKERVLHLFNQREWKRFSHQHKTHSLIVKASGLWKS